jgi:flagellar biosynthesis protein FlhG
MHDQADSLREIAHRQYRGTPGAPAAPQLIAVAGGRVGVGVTSVAVNLAVSFALSGRRTVLVDVDLERPGVAIGCRLETRYSVADVLAGRRSLHEVLERGPGGIQVVTGPVRRAVAADCSPAALRGLLNQLADLGAHADIVVLDIGAGINRTTQAFWQAAERLLVVTTPELDALLDTYAAIKLLADSRTDKAVATLINQAASAEVALDAHERLTRTCRGHLGLRLTSAGWLPTEAALAGALGGHPFRMEVSDSDASRELDRIVEAWSLDAASSAETASTTTAASNTAQQVVPAPHLAATPVLGALDGLNLLSPPGASVG